MHILIATGMYPPDVGGPATYSKLLFDTLPRHGFEVTIVSFGEVRHLPKVVRHFAYFFRIIKLGKKADIIFAQDPVSVGLPALLASKFLRKRFILKVVGDYAWEQWMQRKRLKEPLSPDEFQGRRFGILTELRRLVEHAVARRAETIIVPSRYLKTIVGGWGVDTTKIEVIYNSFKPPQNIGEKETLRGVLQFDGTFIISAGRLVPWKGYKTLIELVPRLRRHYPDLRLIIAGSGPDEAMLEKYIQERNLEKSVVMTGPLAHDTLMHYIKAADVFVLNTLYEGFSHILLEAMALGTPIVTTDVGGNKEMIKDGKQGFLVNYNDKKALERVIIKTLDDAGLSKTFGINSKKRILDFNEERMIGELIKILHRNY